MRTQIEALITHGFVVIEGENLWVKFHYNPKTHKISVWSWGGYSEGYPNLAAWYSKIRADVRLLSDFENEANLLIEERYNGNTGE